MNILVFNCGSSSINYKLYQTQNEKSLDLIIKGKGHRVGTSGTSPSFIEHFNCDEVIRTDIKLKNHQQAARLILNHLIASGFSIDMIGHRFVHGGERFQKSTLLTDEIIDDIEACLPLAPIHNPNSWRVIKECQSMLPDIPQYLTFDTAFHANLEPYVYSYALPQKLREEYGLRKYGFHGLSYQYISLKVPEILDISPEKLKMIVCHLGTGGSSVAAIQNGQSIDTSMGFSPTAGLIMSTRCGDIDPSIPIFLADELNYPPEHINRMLNKESGLLGISKISSDLRDLFKEYESNGDKKAQLAIKMYVHQLIKYIGAYAAILNGLDILVFTDDVGVQCRLLRKMVCDHFSWFGIQLDNKLNNKNSFNKPEFVNSDNSSIKVLVMPTDEELMIGYEGVRILEDLEIQ